ncbi:MAG: transglycosylase SLT domain-containing protein [Treponema sp.]|nr:transglycosylase SLT domain-containing protein [Treponema sp.]
MHSSGFSTAASVTDKQHTFLRWDKLAAFAKTFPRRMAVMGVFAFLLGVCVSVHAEGRPLRSVQRDVPSIVPRSLLPTPHSPLPIPNSLITSTALEQQLTKHYIAQYTNRSGVAYLNAALERGNVYLPFIKEEIAKRNLPPELVYLPIIESSYQITARSRSGAVGLWQFMMNSISPFNIRVTDSIDERRDFIKSTRGALQKLDDNYRTLGNWELALAAYNCGLGAMTRTIQRTGVRDYWELSRRNELRQETTHYVPKLVAAAYVLSQPRKYGINIWLEPFEWTAVTLRRQISLDILAEEAEINRDLLRRLNAQLLQGITPASGGFQLIVPAADVEKVKLILERDDLKLLQYHYHIVRHGDTLWSMSRHYGTSLNLIEQHNPGISNRYLKIGETIVIPAFGDTPPLIRPAVTTDFNASHVVQKGETFWSLGRRFGVDPQALAEANGMTLNQILHEGRTLKVPILE